MGFLLLLRILIVTKGVAEPPQLCGGVVAKAANHPQRQKEVGVFPQQAMGMRT